MTTAALNVAVIGLGWWGRIIVPLAKASSQLRVVRVADPAPAAAQFAASQDLPLSKSLDEVLRDPQVQGVVLCTPHTQHTEQVVRAANAKKHVFCEKPLAMSRSDVLKSVAACNANGVKLAAGHEKRFEPPIQELMRMVKPGELGTPPQCEANFVQDKLLSLPADHWRLSSQDTPPRPLTPT